MGRHGVVVGDVADRALRLLDPCGDAVVPVRAAPDRPLDGLAGSDLLDRIRSTPFNVATSSENLTVSVGLATASVATDLQSLADRANEAKRIAKSEGRDRVVFWKPPNP